MRSDVPFWVLLAVCCVPPAGAAEVNVFSRADVNMRTGPASSYPIVGTVADNQIVTVHGCVAQYRWCDVDWAGRRGWVSAKYLKYPTSSAGFAEAAGALGIPVVDYVAAEYQAGIQNVRAEPAGVELGADAIGTETAGAPEQVIVEEPGQGGPTYLPADNADLLGGDIAD